MTTSGAGPRSAPSALTAVVERGCLMPRSIAARSRPTLGSRSPLLRYGVATLLSALAMLLTLLLGPLLAKTPSPLFFAAVALSARFGGLGPALLATLLSALALGALLLEPEGQLTAASNSLLHLGAFVLVAILVAVLDERRRRAEEHALNAAARLRLLSEASRMFSAAVPDWSVTLEVVAKQAAGALGDACVISLRSEDGRWLTPVAWHHPDPEARALLKEIYASVRHGADEGPSGRVLQTGQALLRPVVAPNEVRAATKPEYRPYLDRFAIHSLLIVPLRARDRTFGTLALSRNAPGHPYTVADQNLLQDLADRAALAIDNARFSAYHRALFDGVVEALVVADAERRFLDVNPAAARLLGYTQEELSRLRVDDVAAGDGAWSAAEWDRFLQAGSWHGEMDLRRKDGGSVQVEVLAMALALPAGVAYLASWHDVSERRALDRLREEFLASVSHDLRTPLTAARAGLGLLEASADDRLQPDERALARNALRNIERLDMLIGDLLTVNQLEAGTLRLQPEPLDARIVVADAMASVHSLIVEKGQMLEPHLPEPLAIEGDARRLEQAIVNLLANAHRHTPPGTRITVSGAAAGGEVRLTVADDGPGIPPPELERIFQRFHRLGGGRGSGLGLAIARGIYELNGGRVWAENCSGGGAAFQLALPVYQDGEKP